MDEALVLAAVDVSGRGMLCFNASFKTEKIGTFDTELVEEFFIAFATNAGITLHIRQLAGTNSHHIAEAVFKAVARALRGAVAKDPDAPDEVPSTKGVL
jgi:imidazoleglycerol-phosphate dehydratase